MVTVELVYQEQMEQVVVVVVLVMLAVRAVMAGPVPLLFCSQPLEQP
jgi:hypothetical protein